jgi:hypothetical protein
MGVEKARSMDFSGLWDSIKAAVDVNPWRAAAFAVAGAILLSLNAWGTLPFELPSWALPIIGVITVVAAAIAILDLMKTLVFALGATIKWLGELWTERQARCRVLRYLDTLSPREKEILGYLLARNERSIISALDGGYAQPLVAKGILRRPRQMGTSEDMTHIIPEFVWLELKRRQNEFPDTYRGKAHPWRRAIW